MEGQLNEQPRRRETRVVYRSEERKIQILSLRQLSIVSCLARHVSMTRSRESPPPEDFETEFGNPLRLPRTYVSLRATDPVHWRADNRHVTIHQRSAALLRELAQRGNLRPHIAKFPAERPLRPFQATKDVVYVLRRRSSYGAAFDGA
jgi:hypothetical protein